MARYHGYVGYAIDVEAYPGVWESTITEREYYGDVIKNKTNIQQTTSVNPTISISNSISILADAFIYDNCSYIKYATYMGKKWYVTAIEIETPRITLTLGGLYNEQ